MTDATCEVKISVKGVVPGMYVSRLDRPWLETPFSLEGLLVRTSAEVSQLQRVCAHVYIDPARGVGADRRDHVLDRPSPLDGAAALEEIEGLRRTRWTSATGFAAELPSAEAAHTRLENGIQEVMDDLVADRAVDLSRLKTGVEAMVDSILRNPSAFLWLKEMKRTDNYAYRHAMGCAIWAASFGRHLGLEKDELQVLSLGGLLCDIGKMQLPPDLLSGSAPLSPDARETMQRHVEFGTAMIERLPGLPAGLVEMVATHHERHDGSGYPRGLQGMEIPIFGRIIGLVDSYDAMTSERTYAAGRSPNGAVEELYHSRGTLFQPELVEQFIQSCGIYPTGSLVELSTGEVAVIIEVHALKRLRPRVMLLLDRAKRPLPQFHEIDLCQVQDRDGEPLAVKCGLPSGAYGIRSSELFLD